MREWAAIFRSRRMAVVYLLGFSSGLPLMLTGQTLQQWAYDEHLDIKKLSTFALLKLPYTFKWAWAPLLDRYRLPFLGRRRGWMLVFQIALMLGIGAMAGLDPATALPEVMAVALFVATMAASQDIMIDAYNVEVLRPEERAAGSATYVIGYRTAMLVSGSLALIMADHLVWRVVYIIMAALMLVGAITVFFAEEPTLPSRPPRTLFQSVVLPFGELVSRYRWHALTILLFCATFKFGEQFAQVLSQPFYRDMGFTKSEIGSLSKAVGFAAFAVGGGIGGSLVARYGMRRMLVAFGILQSLVHVGYLVIALAGHNLGVYGVTLFVENFSFAMATAAVTGAQMSFCSPAVAATQMALLSSLTGVAQSIFGPFAGTVVRIQAYHGARVAGDVMHRMAHLPLPTAIDNNYPRFFVITMLMGIPGIVLAWFATSPANERLGSSSVSSTASPA
jgi:MFS transporter, PAT family, beta-lactamase induction signal transducer AmpG